MATTLQDVYNAYLNTFHAGGDEKPFSASYSKAFPIMYAAGLEDYIDENDIRCCECGKVISAEHKIELKKTATLSFATCSDECVANLITETYSYAYKEDREKVNQES
jgi:hypothetical protein